jgi:hypothetical protein
MALERQEPSRGVPIPAFIEMSWRFRAASGCQQIHQSQLAVIIASEVVMRRSHQEERCLSGTSEWHLFHGHGHNLIDSFYLVGPEHLMKRSKMDTSTKAALKRLPKSDSASCLICGSWSMLRVDSKRMMGHDHIDG